MGTAQEGTRMSKMRCGLTEDMVGSPGARNQKESVNKAGGLWQTRCKQGSSSQEYTTPTVNTDDTEPARLPCVRERV